MPRLTPQVQKDIVALLRAGAFAHVAAEAAGVRWALYRRWLTRGKKAGPKTRFHVFRTEVMRATAQARARAELEVYQKSPLLWLKHGPGRERHARPGWTNPARPAALKPAGDTAHALDDPVTRELFADLLDALTPFPEARLKAAAILPAQGETPDPKARQPTLP